MEVPKNWRLQKIRYGLEGNRCPISGETFFPPRKCCVDCRNNNSSPVENSYGTIFKNSVTRSLSTPMLTEKAQD